jgi:hypothetical protein
MKVILNENKELVESIKAKIKDNNGHCPCAIVKNADTKCICKDFRDKCANGYLGECNCGLYKSIPSIVYIYGDTHYTNEILHWNDYFSKMGFIVFMPELFRPYKLTDEQIVSLKNVYEQKLHFADTIFIVDRYGEITEKMKKLIDAAKKLGKKIMYASETDTK